MLLDADTKKKLREMGVKDLVDTLEGQEGDPPTCRCRSASAWR